MQVDIRSALKHLRFADVDRRFPGVDDHHAASTDDAELAISYDDRSRFSDPDTNEIWLVQDRAQ